MHDQLESSELAGINAKSERQILRRIGLIATIVVVTIVIAGISVRAQSNTEVRRWTDERAIPTVSVFLPQQSDAKSEIALPGTLEAFNEAPIFARVSGYLKKWNVDIGAHVRAGQVMAEIDTPELDQQLAQVSADLASAVSNEKLAETTARRWKNLLATDSVSEQEADQKSADLSAKHAAVLAAQANVNRVRALESFKHVVAPFDGTVTARSTDIGALINAGSGSGVELFRVADVSTLRVYARIPQNYASRIKIGMAAHLSIPERPGQVFTSTLKRTSGEINTGSGTLLVELEVDNKRGLLIPGGYTEIKLDLAGNTATLKVPASALIVRMGGVQLATIDKNNRVVLKNVNIGRDFGTHVEILSGLDANDKIVNSPPDSIEQGDLVRLEQAAQPPAGSSQPRSTGSSHG